MSEICLIHNKNLVCPSCIAIERGRLGGQRSRPPKAENPLSVKKKSNKNPHAYTAFDCLEAFKAHPDQTFNCADLVEGAPAGKQASAKKVMPRRLSYLFDKGLIERVLPGKYGLAAKLKIDVRN